MKKYKTKKMNLQLFAGETITDLTGYTWVGNDNIPQSASPSSNEGYSINFVSNNFNYEDFTLTEDGMNDIFYGISNDIYYTSAYHFPSWSSEAYKTIQIIGGTDATNSTLIAWLQANGTLTAPQPTGYSSTINLTNCTCNKQDETGLSGSYTATVTANDGYYLSSITSTLGTSTIATNKKTAIINITDVTEDFTINAVGTIKTQKDILLHPNNNGEVNYTIDMFPQVRTANTLEINRLFRTEYTITTVITNGIASGDVSIWSGETAQVTITPDENYSLPNTITVTGASYTYDSTTGVVSLSNATGNVTISATCESISSGYSGNITTYQSGYGTSTRIKFDTTPSSNNDYDAYVDMNGIITGSTTYTNKIKVYVWGSSYQVPKIKINNTEYSGSNNYSTATEVVLNGDYDIYLGYAPEIG